MRLLCCSFSLVALLVACGPTDGKYLPPLIGSGSGDGPARGCPLCPSEDAEPSEEPEPAAIAEPVDERRFAVDREGGGGP